MLVIVALPIIWQFRGSLWSSARSHNDRVPRCVFPNVIVPMKRVERRKAAWPMRWGSRRGPECLGVRASWPPVVAFVVMNERPAPRCKRRRYRWAVLAQPIRMSTVGIHVCIFLAFIPHARPHNSARPSLRAQRRNPSRGITKEWIASLRSQWRG